MVTIAGLWLPILVAAVGVFFASFLAWMVLPHHKADWKGVPEEDEFLAGLRAKGVAPGQYMFPYCSDPSVMKEEAFKARWKAGPHGTLNVWSGPPNMGKNLTLTFLSYCLIGLFVAYLATMSMLVAGSEFMEVFRFTGAAAVSIYALGPICEWIWFGKSVRSFVTSLIDNVVYGVLTGVLFALLWPSADAALTAGL